MKQKAEEAPGLSTNVNTIPNATSSSNSNAMDTSSQEVNVENPQDTKDDAKDAEGGKVKKEEAPKEVKPQDKSRPISSTPVPGTPWYDCNSSIISYLLKLDF